MAKPSTNAVEAYSPFDPAACSYSTFSPSLIGCDRRPKNEECVFPNRIIQSNASFAFRGCGAAGPGLARVFELSKIEHSPDSGGRIMSCGKLLVAAMSNTRRILCVL
jgi:hypothetical protein